MIIYVAGPYNGKTYEEIDRNIQAAREIAIVIWRMGHVALCPHLNTAHFEVNAGLPETAYLDGDRELLAVCDAIVMTPDWERSRGASAELEQAKRMCMPWSVYPDIPWLPA